MTTLGRTGLRVSRAGLGCGGHSRLGQSYGKTVDQSVAIVRAAIDAGVNLIDTASSYGTEPIVGQAIRPRDRDDVVVVSKHPAADREGNLISGDAFIDALDRSLGSLGLDAIDVYLVHAVTIDQYPHVRDELVPALQWAREQGKVRFFGVSERWVRDPSHEMLRAALPDDLFDVAMVGFNLLNPSARRTVFPLTAAHRVGVLNMFSVRSALSRPDRLTALIDQLHADGALRDSAIDAPALTDLLTRDAADPPEAAYRFCAHEPGIDSVLTGTGNADHLAQNLSSIQGPPLPDRVCQTLDAWFGHIDQVSGN